MKITSSKKRRTTRHAPDRSRDSGRRVYSNDRHEAYDYEDERPRYREDEQPRRQPAPRHAPPPPRSRQNHKQPRRKRRGVAVVAVLLILLIGLGTTAFIGYRDISGRSATAVGDIVIDIPDGASTGTVAQLLKDSGLIRNALLFRIFSRINGADGTFQMGNHVITSGMTYQEIIDVLQQMTYIDLETFLITFPEGTTCLKMAMMLEEMGVCTVSEFVYECNNGSFECSFLSEISTTELKFLRLEGFLYPDTYEFVVGVTAHDIIQQMLENFENRVLTPEVLEQVRNSGYSLEEIIILASIVEKETVPGEEKNIASVFFNRLRDGSQTNHRLQADCARAWWSDGVTPYDETGYIHFVIDYYYGGRQNVPPGMVAAYDSYTISGIIIGAICNPGIACIDGVLNPNDTPYFYYFSTPPDKPPIIIVYSETYYEHVQRFREWYY